MQKVIVKHMTGSKANQTEVFELPIDAITFGRETSCKVAYDPVKDDLVSRTHIKITLAEDNQFLLTDLGSSNGTFVNGQKIAKPITLQAGDIVQLGKDGPKFEFELDPRPPVAAKSTRLQEIPIPKSTRENQVSSTAESQYIKTDIQNVNDNPKQGVGRETVERLIGRVESDARIKIAETESKTRRKIVNISAGIFTAIALVAGYFVYQNHQSQRQLQATEEQLKSNIAATKEEQSKQMKEIKSNAPMSAAEISQKYGSATVFIETSWKLRHVKSGQQLYQMQFCYEFKAKAKSCNKTVPAFVYFKVGEREYVEPILYTGDEEKLLSEAAGKGIPIGGAGTGSGFVVDKDGFILTNKHVAAAWEAEYDGFEFPGLLYCLNGGNGCEEKALRRITSDKNDRFYQLLLKWIPNNTQSQGGQPPKGKYVEGYHDYLDVTFPGLGQRSRAHLVRVSENADMALIKIDTMRSLTSVKLGNGDSVLAGNGITVIGYPSISPDLSMTKQNRVVPEPTTTAGNVGKVLRQKKGVELDDFGKWAEKHIKNVNGSKSIDVFAYQLTINATGTGTSGAPVFNDKGEVIGVFTAMLRDELGTMMSLALPIEFGYEIMK